MPETSSSDPELLNRLKAACKDTLKCMQCGVCSGSCPSGRHTALNIRRLVRKAARTTDVLKDEQLWMCTTCYNCQERCPRDIDIVDVVLTLRSIAVHEGIMLAEHTKVSELLLEYGHAVPIDEERRKQRVELGLEEMPLTVHKYPDDLKEVKSLLISCGFDSLLDNKGKRNAETETG
ncbi:CoB--CoM heterodisulfide reductase subunit C [Methanolobus psychrophilus R15]|nr:CoB--CoM heterodisulfide reductase subunit C [Methanolobus psychrophilus R15]